MTPKRPNSGKSAAVRNGATGETIVESYRQTALALGVARLDKIPTPTRNTGRRIVYLQRSTVDAVGYMLDSSGRVVAEEVKTVSTGRAFPLSEVEPHQRAYLDHVHAVGGVAVLTVVWRERPKVPLYTVSVFHWPEVREAVSLPSEVLASRKVTPKNYLREFLRTPLRAVA